MQTTDALVRVKTFTRLAKLLTGKSLDADAFDVVLRNIYSDSWVLIDPSILCQKKVSAPKRQVIFMIESLGKQRIANVFKARSDDGLRFLYLVQLNPIYISKTCRRKTCLYTMSGLSKPVNMLNGDLVLYDQSKCGNHWEELCKMFTVKNGESSSERRIDFHKIKWERVL